MITGFAEFITESDQRKNTHLTHLEDVIIDDGPAGAPFALKILREFGRVLDGGKVSKALNVSVKWDGAPALIFGLDPADKRFFVATKGAFAKTPKLAKSHADIDSMYQSGVKTVLHLAFDELQALQPKGVLQGDVLFAHDTLKRQTIDKGTFLTFQPNTILYAVDVNSDLGKQITAATMGIVIHTMYQGTGNSLASYGATAVTPSVFSSLKRTKRVVSLDARYDDVSGTATFTDEERNDFALAMSHVESVVSKVSSLVYNQITDEPFHPLFQQFINNQVKQNRRSSPTQSVTDLLIFLDDKKNAELASRSSDAGKERIHNRFADVTARVRAHQREYVAWFELHQALSRAKEIVVRKLGQASRVSSFVRNAKGDLEVTGPEGFVAVAHSGKAVKLVDRLEFSRLNFLAPKTWQ